MDPPRRCSVWLRWLAAHAAVVVACTVVVELIVFAAPPRAGFDVGVVSVALPLMALGLPWYLPTFIDPYRFDGLDPLLWSLVYVGPAFLTVAPHGALFSFVSRRRRRRPASAAGPAQG